MKRDAPINQSPFFFWLVALKLVNDYCFFICVFFGAIRQMPNGFLIIFIQFYIRILWFYTENTKSNDFLYAFYVDVCNWMNIEIVPY